MDVAPREQFGLGSKLKKFVRKVIPNELAEIATKAAPFVAPFNPLLAAGMAGIGGFDKTGRIGKSLRNAALTYGGGQLARFAGGAGFQKGINPFQGADFSGGMMSGIKSLGSSPIGMDTGLKLGQYEMFGGTPPSDVVSNAPPMSGDPAQYLTDDALSVFEQTAVDTGKKTVGQLGKDLVSGDISKMGNAAKELGGKALKSIYTNKDGSLDKTALYSTLAGVSSYIEAKKLADEAGLEDDEYTEDMYNADKQGYKEAYAVTLDPANFAQGGRVNFLEGGSGNSKYNSMVTKMYIEAGGEEGTGMTIDEFANEYFKKFAKGGRAKLEGGGIPSITLEENEEMIGEDMTPLTNDLLMGLSPITFLRKFLKKDEDIDTTMYRASPSSDSEEIDTTMYRASPSSDSEEIDTTMYRASPQEEIIIPKEKPMDRFMLDEVMSEKGMNTLSENTRDEAMRMYAEKAYKKGQISEEEYREIMGFKDGGITSIRNNYAMGSEVPIRENPVGIKEMDFRETGGFVPPIGVKEKADDIPAMLSNNEFVFTADAVRAAGGGNINKGAQRMYQTMKALEGKA
jgi:hypothetical protein